MWSQELSQARPRSHCIQIDALMHIQVHKMGAMEEDERQALRPHSSAACKMEHPQVCQAAQQWRLRRGLLQLLVLSEVCWVIPLASEPWLPFRREGQRVKQAPQVVRAQSQILKPREPLQRAPQEAYKHSMLASRPAAAVWGPHLLPLLLLIPAIPTQKKLPR